MTELVLIIESDINKLRKMREVLSKEGFNLITVTDREAGINICRKLSVNYILANPLDLGMNEEQANNH